MEKYLNIENFDNRKVLAKFRCPDHSLEIEKGRHKKIPRTGRFCKRCSTDILESEKHVLSECKVYEPVGET